MSRKRLILLIAATWLLTLGVYAPAMRGGFIWDDDLTVTKNPMLRTAEGLRLIWFKPGATLQYYPLVFTSFWVEYHLWGLQPFGYHLVNVLLHALNALLFWLVLRRLSVSGALLAAGIFALHPVHVESVAWITERKNVLSGFFYLAALLAYLQFNPLDTKAPKRTGGWGYYGLAVLLFLCALLSKTVTCSLPAGLLLLSWWKRDRVGRRDLAALVPLFVLGASLALVTIWMEEHHVGARGETWALSFVERCLIAGRALWFYAGKLVWPQNLSFIYPRWQIDSGIWWQYLFPLAAVAVMLALWLMRRRIEKGPVVAVLFFAGTLVPALGFFDVYPMLYSFVADHFQYLASMGLITLGVAAGTAFAGRFGQRGRYVGSTSGVLVVVLLGLLTWKQGRHYKDLETLWRDTLAKNPTAWMAHNNLGVVLDHNGNLEEAQAHYSQALRIKPDYAEAHNNLGGVLADRGNYEDAILHYGEALRIKPDYADAHYNLGRTLADQGKLQEAIGHYAEALRIQPLLAKAHNNWGIALARQGKVQQAIEHYVQALRIRPDDVKVHFNLGNILFSQGKIKEAILCYQGALRIQPEFAEAHNNLANALLKQGTLQEAIVHYSEALRINPDYAKAHYNLGSAFISAGNVREAVEHYHETLRIKPEWPRALGKMAWILSTHHDPQFRNGQEAVQLAQQACKLTDYKSAFFLDVLAAAYAEERRFTKAEETAQRAIDLAMPSGQRKLAEEIRNHLTFYESGRPYRQKSDSVVSAAQSKVSDLK